MHACLGDNDIHILVLIWYVYEAMNIYGTVTLKMV